MNSNSNELVPSGGRELLERDLAFDAIAETWSDFIANYDTDRRIEVLINEFLGNEIKGKDCLDGGCGLGYFSQALQKLSPGSVTAVDISPKLTERIKALIPGINSKTVDILYLSSALDKKFDIVVSSEVVEHTPNPEEAVKQLGKVVKSGGLIAISCPNKRWIWLLRLAQVLKLRSNYKGYENWVSPNDLVKWLEESNFEIIRREGVHIVPWQFLPKSLLKRIDVMIRKFSYPFALNLAVLARKR